MMKKRLSKKIWYGSDVDSEGNPVLPPLAIDSNDLEGLHYGELYLHIADDKLSLWTRTLTDQVKQIGGSGSGDGELWQLRQTDAGEPYLFSPFDVAVQRGLTSFVDGGALNLPSIYDGLPIDGDTLYWVLDENGKKVMLKAAGGGGGVADSVHWDNIEGKPNFDDYATQEALKDYLPLSGGTMTGQINMPVGIGNAIKFGEESRLFASNGNFYISAETHLVLASGASGSNVPNNVVINKDGRMFIANNLAVGHAGFIMDSYKLNVAGDAYVNGKLVVSGTIYPSISSLHNIGDSSKRFACIHADSVDVGGVKIRLLQDGVLLIDGNLAVKGGITSYVDGGDLDLPSIYDGLPIDGDTLYWVLDENGKKVMLKSKGGDEEGGGSVKSLLRWSGFREGSWDGSEEKTIEIPAKLSELENDGKFFADGGWIGSDANSVIFGSYLYGGYAANTPKNVGQLLAFNNGDLESWNRGSQIFIEGENFYYRLFWDNSWKNWRKVISGNSDGVIDYDLTLGGNLTINGEEYNEIKTVCNPDFSIGNLEDLGWKTAIKHALRFRWHEEAYEIGTIRGASSNSVGFGVTYQNNQLVWRVNKEQMDVFGNLNVGGSLNLPSGYSQVKCGEKNLLECYSGTDTYLHGENSLYLVSNGLYTLQNGVGCKILHEGNYRDYEYTAKRLSVTDIRNTTPKPSDVETLSVTAQFANTDNPGDGWYSGLSIQGWTNDYKAWQLRSGAWDFASDHLYFRNGVLETWNDWRRVITGDVDGVLDSNLEVKGEEGGNIKFVYNSDSAITENKPNDLASIRHALRFPWHGEAYEIGTIRGNAAHSDGFGITHQNNHLVWKVNTKQMDVYGDLIVKGIVDSVTITSLQEQLNGLWKRNWFEDLSATMIMADNASFERLYGDSIIIGDCKLSYDYEKKTLVIQKFDGTDTNVVISGGLTTYSTNV